MVDEAGEKIKASELLTDTSGKPTVFKSRILENAVVDKALNEEGGQEKVEKWVKDVNAQEDAAAAKSSGSDQEVSPWEVKVVPLNPNAKSQFQQGAAEVAASQRQGQPLPTKK